MTTIKGTITTEYCDVSQYANYQIILFLSTYLPMACENNRKL